MPDTSLRIPPRRSNPPPYRRRNRTGPRRDTGPAYVRARIDPAIAFAIASLAPEVALTVIASPPHAGSFNKRSLQSRFAHSGVPKCRTVASDDDAARVLSGFNAPTRNVPGFAFSLGVWKIRITAPPGPVSTRTSSAPSLDFDT